MSSEVPSKHLIDMLQSHYQIALEGKWTRLTGGYECDIWRVGDVVIRLCPSWRSEDEMRWTYAFVAHCAEHLKQVIVPIPTQLGEPFIAFQGRIVLVLPFVDGKPLGTSDEAQIRQAGDLLGQIHNMSQYLPKDSQRPPSKTTKPNDIPKRLDPKSIQDDTLDTWYKDFIQRNDLRIGMMHGDYYHANILCQDGYIAGIIDWDECEYGALIREVAWATWELCHMPSGDHLDRQKVLVFLQAYTQSNPEMVFDSETIIQLIRYHLRYEIRRSIAMEKVGEVWDDDYRQSEIRAFNNLRGISLWG